MMLGRGVRPVFLIWVIGLLALTGCAIDHEIAASSAIPSAPETVAQTPLRLSAITEREYAAPDADQGVAVDVTHFYAIDNTVIAKHDRHSGALVARWAGPKQGLIRHLNSCFAEAGLLLCANSTYSLTPHGSSLETFDARDMTHQSSLSLGLTESGSLTWFARLGDGWIASFAHYTGDGGLPFKDHRFSSLATFDAEWRRTGGWALPVSAVERMAPSAASGGAIGPDGLLYVLGRDRPEMYVLAKPSMGPVLIHVATIGLEAEGQAFAFAEGRAVMTIDRRLGRVRLIRLPPVSLDAFPEARLFERGSGVSIDPL